MKLYYAGAQTPRFQNILLELGLNNILVSYYYMWSSNAKAILSTETLKKKWFNIFMDSGWFSARVSGMKLDLVQYKDFLVSASKLCDVSANLDDWPWKEQQANLVYLASPPAERVIPVYHMDEYEAGMWSELDELFDQHEYIAIWWLAGENVTDKLKEGYLNFVFSRWYKYYKKGKKIKIHWFWITWPSTCLSYPFYSVDSTTRLSGAKFWTMYIRDKLKRWFVGIHHSDEKKIAKYWDSVPPHLRSFELLCDKHKSTGSTIYMNRISVTAYAFELMRQDVTNVWKARWITF